MSLAEQYVLGAVFRDRASYTQARETGLGAEHFESRPFQLLYRGVEQAYAGADSIDPLTVVDGLGDPLYLSWGETRDSAVHLIEEMKKSPRSDLTKHAALVKKDAQVRSLQALGARLMNATGDPETIASEVAHEVTRIATNRMLTNEILSYGDLWLRFYERFDAEREAKARGEDLGIKFGLRFLDNWLNGLRPTEMAILAGEPGMGKSAVAFAAGMSYATRQARKPKEQRKAALILCLEMGEEPNSYRLAAAEGGIDSARLRQADVSDDELARIARNWGSKHKDIPLYWNFTSMIRAHQMRALIAEAVRVHNVGLVIIDHMRFFKSGERYDNRAEEDEAKAEFLKLEIAKDLGVAVFLLAHTTKAVDSVENRRPRLSHLRGGGMVSAHADAVMFVYRPWVHATDDDRLAGRVTPTDAEMIYEKNRHGLSGDSMPFYFDPSVMVVRDV